MKTIDDGLRAIRSLYNKRNISKEFRSQLDNELKEFKKNVEDKPLLEQQQIFYEKFGHFVTIDFLIQTNNYLKGIKNQLTFFVIIVIITFLIGLLSLFINL
jgi:hypothetical protein